MPKPAPRPEKDAFIQTVLASGLLSQEELTEALKRVPPTDRAKIVARQLVQDGKLTRFQAERLLAGRSDGFILGQYHILDEIGRGGMGRVYKAEHRAMGRIVALKVLSPEMVKTPKARSLFEKEMKAVGRLTHPNIVAAYDANTLSGRTFIVLEFVDGANLSTLIKSNGPLPLSQACEYVRQAAAGLDYAHKRGLIHRDIKPANLLVAKEGTTESQAQLKILDFGLALATVKEGEVSGDSTAHGQNTVMGTPDYLSPEQARNHREVDHRSDIYSLGCTFYFLLTGQVPFPGGTVMEKLVRHSSMPPVPVEKLRPEISPDILAILRKMMAKKPDGRYQTADELALALTPFGTHQGQWVMIPSAIAVVSTDVELVVPTELTPTVDPWAVLGDENPQTEAPTFSETKGITREQPALTSPKRKSNRFLWLAIILFVLFLVCGGIISMIYFVLRPLVLKATE